MENHLVNRKPFREGNVFGRTINEGQYLDGDLRYTVERSANTNEISYQEASGAPVEADSPLGYSVGAVTIIFLNLSKMIGTGIYSTRKLGFAKTDKIICID